MDYHHGVPTLTSFVSFLLSVQLCKELTEKTDHGSEIKGKLRLISVL